MITPPARRRIHAYAKLASSPVFAPEAVERPLLREEPLPKEEFPREEPLPSEEFPREDPPLSEEFPREDPPLRLEPLPVPVFKLLFNYLILKNH